MKKAALVAIVVRGERSAEEGGREKSFQEGAVRAPSRLQRRGRKRRFPLRRGNCQSPFRRFVVSGSHQGAAHVESSLCGRNKWGGARKRTNCNTITVHGCCCF